MPERAPKWLITSFLAETEKKETPWKRKKREKAE
jgi:hypothetical protein